MSGRLHPGWPDSAPEKKEVENLQYVMKDKPQQ